MSTAAPLCSCSSVLPISSPKSSTSGPELNPSSHLYNPLLRQNPNTLPICFKPGARLTLDQAPRSRLEDHNPSRLKELPLYPIYTRKSWLQNNTSLAILTFKYVLSVRYPYVHHQHDCLLSIYAISCSPSK